MANKQAVNGQPASYNATPATRSDGDPSGLEVDADGNLKSVEYGCTMTEYDVATDADVTISAVPCVLLGIYINVVLSAHVVNVKDYDTTKLVLPASMSAGTKIDCHSATFATSMIINGDNAGTGKIVFFTRAI